MGTEGAPRFRFLLLRRYSRFTLHAWKRWWRWTFDLLHRKSRWTLWIYGRDNDNPTASCQIVIKQDGIGYIDSALGRDFYDAMLVGGIEQLFATGATALRADVRESHVRLLRIALRGRMSVAEIGRTKAGNVELVSVEITRL